MMAADVGGSFVRLMMVVVVVMMVMIRVITMKMIVIWFNIHAGLPCIMGHVVEWIGLTTC